MFLNLPARANYPSEQNNPANKAFIGSLVPTKIIYTIYSTKLAIQIPIKLSRSLSLGCVSSWYFYESLNLASVNAGPTVYKSEYAPPK